MKVIKCKDCILLDKCPSGQRCVQLIENFMRYCPVGKIKETTKEEAHEQSKSNLS